MRWLLIVPAVSGCVTAKQHRDVRGELSAVNDRLTALEERLAPLLPASPEEEQQSNALLDQTLAATQSLQWDTARQTLDTILTDFPNTQAAQAALRLAEEVAVVGRAEAELDVERWFQGSADDLSDDKATLYVFWEAWCPHCRREVPKLSATYDQFRDQGLGIVGLTDMTRDVTEDDVSAFIEDNGVNYPIAKAKDQALAQAYSIQGIPAAALVADGEVVWRGHPGWLTDDLLVKVLSP